MGILSYLPRPIDALPVANSAAVGLSGRLLSGLGTRWAHSVAVADRIGEISPRVEPVWRAPLADAAWLHDIGRSPTVAAGTGLHSLDGARWLHQHDWPDATCRLVAWHSAPLAEARLRALDDALVSAFDPPPALPLAALTWADMTSSPNGNRCSVDQRLADILARYPPESVVHRATVASAEELRAAVKLVEDLIGGR